MSAVRFPTRKEINQVDDIINRFGQANKAKIDRDLAKVVRKIDKDRALATECEGLSQKAYEQIMKALPDECSKDLFMRYSMLVSGRFMLSHAIYIDTSTIYRLIAETVKDTEKLLGKS